MQYAIMTDEDKPPPAQSEMKAARGSASLYLDFTRLYKTLKKKNKFISLTETRFTSMHVLKSHEEKLTVELLDYLEQRWSGIELQKVAVFGDRLDRYLAIGIASAHSLQNQGSSQSQIDPEHEMLVHSESADCYSASLTKPEFYWLEIWSASEKPISQIKSGR